MTSLLLALSISLDNLGIGISYGIKKIKIGKIPLLIITLMSLATLAFSWLIGQILLSTIPIFAAKLVSSLLLISLGILIFAQALFDTLYPSSGEGFLIKKLRIKSLRIIINIIREPSSSDIDRSGIIDIKESFYIGAALSIDSLSVGLAVSTYGASLLPFLILAGILNISLLKFGEFVGRYFGKMICENKLKFISGTIILLMGILKMA